MREFYPQVKPRVWGGTKLREWFPKAPDDQLIGEAWLLSDHPSGRTIDVEGRPITGENDPNRWFPVLIKVLHANADLSVQVHPDDQLAAEKGDRGKTEGWLILEAKEGAKICYGHHFATREEMKQAIENGKITSGLRYLEVHPDEFYPVPPGTVHALGAGLIVLEVQQASDLTYRLYDYDRLENGKPRQLHVDDGVLASSFPQQVESAECGVPDALTEWLMEPVTGAVLYDRQPYFEFAGMIVEGQWENQLRQGFSLVIIALEGDVRPLGSLDTQMPFRTWLYGDAEKIELTGHGKVALVAVPTQTHIK